MAVSIHTDALSKKMYATDASAYRELPYGVAYPRSVEDIRDLVDWARTNKIPLIPRAGGTSLAGQVVGNGLVVDVSRHLHGILAVNIGERWVEVEPGVILDQLNLYLRPMGFFFAPETSTSNRCCLGGMLGNNSCGSHSLVYGSTRDHVLEVEAVLSDGKTTRFRRLTDAEISEKTKLDGVEGDIYRYFSKFYAVEGRKEFLRTAYPDPDLKRRNTGYALDELGESNNLCTLLAGSEGTLCLVTKIRLRITPLPPAHISLLCVHCTSLEQSFEVNLALLKEAPRAIELMDAHILELSKTNMKQSDNRFFIKGEPQAILVAEFGADTEAELDLRVQEVQQHLQSVFPDLLFSDVRGKDRTKVWELRKSALGLLSNMNGEARPVSVIEDTAVVPHRLPAYLRDMAALMQKYGIECVYHAHIGSGELHLRPVLNLKKQKDREIFVQVARETAQIVKKHRGSLSGEHGDGRLRGEFIPLIYGDEVYRWFQEVKKVFDPQGIFNPGKITDTPPMDSCLRYEETEFTRDLSRVNWAFDYGEKGFLPSIERCNGSADCRKPKEFHAQMCPVYQADAQEYHTTRARANVLRECLHLPQKNADKLSNKEILEILSHCLSCKACRRECPSNIDMARYKSEILYQYGKLRGFPWKTLAVAYLPLLQSWAVKLPGGRGLYNSCMRNATFTRCLKKFLGHAPQRSFPLLSTRTLREEFKGMEKKSLRSSKRKVWFFADEFTNYMEAETGLRFLMLLERLGYEVAIPRHVESGRTAISKGVLSRAKHCAEKNVRLLTEQCGEKEVIVGLEPASVLAFRDEYPDLLRGEWQQKARELSRKVLLYDEFIVEEIRAGNITSESFVKTPLRVYVHGHCHQKAWVGMEKTLEMLRLPENYQVRLVEASCCGMAGAFGYEREHYELSMKIGENQLFPALREAQKVEDFLQVAAPGTSCRQQIWEGTGIKALHPVEILYKALVPED